jgi:bla regulator protein BlaR1
MSNRIAPSLIGFIAAVAALAQAPAPTQFEVASIRPNTANDRIVTINVGPGGRFSVRGYTLKLLIQRAYDVMGWNISGGPGWIDSDRYDVTAKANVAGDLTEAQLRPMLQALLADRFKLKVHQSSKEMAGYALVVGRGGPKVKAAVDGEEHPDTFRMTGTGLSGQGITMENLARYVAGKLGQVAVDQTGLKRVYDLKVTWTVETDQSTGLPGADPRAALQSAVFGALEDQLGLKLRPQKITVQMLVIDSAERASAN